MTFVVDHPWAFMTIFFTSTLFLTMIGFLLLSKIGQESWTRWRRKKLYRNGGYANTLMATKDGLLEEVFEEVSDGKFKYNEQSYVRNPRTTMSYKGIPTHFHMEDKPEPINPWDISINNDSISCGELDTVMNLEDTFNFKEWIENNKPFIIMGGLVLIGLLVASVFFGYTVWQWVRDHGTTVISAAASANIPAN